MADRRRRNRISAEQAANLFSQLVDDSDNSEDEVHSSGSEWEVRFVLIRIFLLYLYF